MDCRRNRVEVVQISKDEMIKTMKRMKSGKSVRPDNTEEMQCLAEVKVEFLTKLTTKE